MNPQITDLFGKPSIDTDYAAATTVREARNPDETVLAGFDLGTFSTDTPVFFLTYKKVIDPEDPEKVSIVNQTGWKALVNADSNTLINLELAPGYEDLGNEIGDFIECVPTSFWGNSLVKGLLEHANPDGSLRTDAVKKALNITDLSADWTPLATVPTVVSVDGQNQATLKYLNVDYRDRLQAGHRIQIPRTTAPPVNSFDFESSNSQYAIKTSAVGTSSITAGVTMSAWLKIESYTAGGVIIGNSNPGETAGVKMRIEGNGTIGIQWFGSGVNRLYVTQQTVPIGEWFHIAVKATFATNSAAVLFNGVSVPLSTGSATGTGFLTNNQIVLGGHTSGNRFDGLIADARIYNIERTTAAIRSDMNQYPLSPANLVAWYKGEGSWSDSSGNGNTLVPSGGAINNFAEHPWKAIEYAIIHAVSLVGADTQVVVFSGTDHNIPEGIVAATKYSVAKSPIGFPSSRNKWRIKYVWLREMTVGSPTSGVWYSPGNVQMLHPVGEWKTRMEGNGQNIPNGNPGSITVGYNEDSSSVPDEDTIWSYSAQTTSHLISPFVINCDRKFNEPTLMHGLIQGSPSNSIGFRKKVVIYAESAWA